MQVWFSKKGDKQKDRTVLSTAGWAELQRLETPTKGNKKQQREKGVTVTWLEYTHGITCVLTHSGHAEI